MLGWRAFATFLHEAVAAADNALHGFAGLGIVCEWRVVHALLDLETALLFSSRLVNVNWHRRKLNNARGVSKLLASRGYFRTLARHGNRYHKRRTHLVDGRAFECVHRTLHSVRPHHRAAGHLDFEKRPDAAGR